MNNQLKLLQTHDSMFTKFDLFKGIPSIPWTTSRTEYTISGNGGIYFLQTYVNEMKFLQMILF